MMFSSRSYFSFPFVLIVFVFVIYMFQAECGWFSSEERSESPIILWWTPFTGEQGNWRTCGEDTCFFTENRTHLSDPKTKMVVFYGSSFAPLDVPLPRQPWQNWALLHEESPKNNLAFCYEPLVSLFNYSATWSRNSSFPLTLLSLPKLSDITDQTYFVSVAEKNRLQIDEAISPVIYVQSSCETPSERDLYVRELEKFIDIDSYGKCVNNKQLPAHLENPAESMHHEDLHRLMAKYKFTIAFENAIGDDYITEKLWRPLKLGSVPVYMGSPSIQDWLPHDNSVVSVWNFTSPESLAAYLHALNKDDTAYSAMLVHKTQGVVENKALVDSMEKRGWSAGDEIDFNSENFVESYECFLCSQMYRTQKEESSGYSSRPLASVDTTHYKCAPPFNPVTRREDYGGWWRDHWNQARAEANVIGRLVRRNQNYSAEEFHHFVFREMSVSA